MRRKQRLFVTAGGLLILGVMLAFIPMGRSDDSANGNRCGPQAVAAMVQDKLGEPFAVSVAVKRIESEFDILEYISPDTPFIGGATLPWGIRNAMERESLKGEVRVGARELRPGQAPFIALVLKPGWNWHYVAVMKVTDEEVLTNEGSLSHHKLRERWRWSCYWGYHLEEQKGVKKL